MNPDNIVNKHHSTSAVSTCDVALEKKKLKRDLLSAADAFVIDHTRLPRIEEEFYDVCSEPLGLPVDSGIKFGKILLKKIEKNKEKVHWRIITLVREPISRGISDLFQDVERFFPDLIDGNGKVEKSRAIELLQERFRNYDESTDYVCAWFDRVKKCI